MIALLLGCAGGETEPPTPSAVPPLAVDGPVWTAPVLEVPAELPPRFTAMLATPAAVEEGSGPDRYPPVGLVQHGLCSGEGPWRAQLVSAVRAQPPDERWRFWELTTQSWCESPGWCAWLAAEAVALGEEGAPYWFGLTQCGDDATASLVEQSAPDNVFVQWALANPGPFRPRMVRIAERTGDIDRRLAVLAVLQHTDGPEAEQALLALHRRAAPADRQQVAMHLGGRDDARTRDLHDDACSGAASPACRWERPDPLRDLSRAVHLGADASAMFARYPNHRTALVAGFERCVTEQAFDAPAVAGTCARALAAEDRAAARAALEEVPGADVELDALRVALGEPDVVGRLRSLGFAIPPDTVPAGPGALDALAAAGLAVSLDEVGGWPPHHERLLYDLAAAAHLANVAWDELAPSAEAPSVPGRVPRVALFAWLEGVRLRTLVDDERGAWDPVRAVGLVNAVLARREVEGRFAIDALERRAVFGPPAALEALAEAQLVTWGTLGP